MLKLFLWLRYLRKKKIVFLSIAAVALSVALLIVVDSLFTGFIDGLKKTDIRGAGDILFIPPFAAEYDTLIDKFEELPDVEGAGPFLYRGGLLHLGEGDVREVSVQGIDAARESKNTELKGSLLNQKAQPAQISFNVPEYPDELGGWVGIGIVAEPNEKTDEYDLEEIKKLVGKQVVLTTFGMDSDNGANSNVKRRVLKLRISDVFYSGVHYRDKTLYLPYDKLYRKLYREDETVRAVNIKIWLRDGVEPALVKPAVWRVWKTFASEKLGLEPDVFSRAYIWTRAEADEPFYAEIRKQMGVLLLIFGVICSVAALLLFCIFYMIVMTRQKDIAIIKSCGITNSSVAFVFIGFGACVGLAGSALGIILGHIITTNINILENWVRVLFGLKLWRSSVYVFEMIPDRVNYGAVWWIVLLAVGACIIGALIPAVVAARTEPVKILRYE